VGLSLQFTTDHPSVTSSSTEQGIYYSYYFACVRCFFLIFEDSYFQFNLTRSNTVVVREYAASSLNLILLRSIPAECYIYSILELPTRYAASSDTQC